MLCGKPVLVAVDDASVDPVKLSGGGLRVKPEDPNAIAEGILALYAMTPEQRTQLGEKGRAYVKQYHSMRYLAEKYMHIFES